MKIEDLQVGDTYQTAFTSPVHIHWKLLEYRPQERVVVGRTDKPNVTFEVPARDFAALVKPIQ